MNNNRPEYEQLYSAYQEAWTRFSTQVSQWQLLLSQENNSTDLALARTYLEHSEFSYREHRNALAAYIFSASGRRFPEQTPRQVDFSRVAAEKKVQDLRFAVKREAHRFWEEGGRQDGRANSDWSRAEVLVYREG